MTLFEHLSAFKRPNSETELTEIFKNLAPHFIYGGYISYENAGKVLNHGFELDIRWNDSYGQFKYDIGANLTWTKNKVKNGNELDQPYDYLNKLGRPSDVILGYVSEGLFGKDIQLDGHPVQMFGDYGNGDIAYADLNNDQIIDEQDRRVIGNTYPRTFLGVDLNFSYKGWGLYILGTAQLGMDKVLNNRYYWNYGERKYSVKALDIHLKDMSSKQKLKT